MPLGLKRYQDEGHLHFITFSCYRREPTLPPFYLLFEHTLEQTRKRYHLDVHGYVLMPEHVHLLLGEPTKEPLAKAIQSLKLSVSKQIGGKQFWQPRYDDFNVFTARKRLEKLNSGSPANLFAGVSTCTRIPSPAASSSNRKTGPTPALATTSLATPTPSSALPPRNPESILLTSKHASIDSKHYKLDVHGYVLLPEHVPLLLSHSHGAITHTALLDSA